MPELPEVEAARRAIEHNCVGKKIKRSIIADDPTVINGVSPADFQASLLGKTIVAAHRKGKNMWLQLDSPPFPSFQFGMAGAIYIRGVAVTKYKRSAVKDTDEWPSKYSKFFIELDDGLELSFTDQRRFGKVRLLKNPASMPPIAELGPDALLEPMTIDEFMESLRKKKIGIKALLLDQSFVSGIGNWIADEVLYQAAIHPLQIAASLSRENCLSLNKCIKEVIQYAVEVDADSSRFPVEWLFHLRWGKQPGLIKGKKIEFIVAGGRTTAYVPELQMLTGSQAAKALSKLRGKIVQGMKGEDHNAAGNEEEKNARSVKSKGGKSAARRMFSRSDKDVDNDTHLKRQTGAATNPPKKKFFTESNKEDEEKNSNGDDDKTDHEKTTKTTMRSSKKATTMEIAAMSTKVRTRRKFNKSNKDDKEKNWNGEDCETVKKKKTKTTEMISKKATTGGSSVLG